MTYLNKTDIRVYYWKESIRPVMAIGVVGITLSLVVGFAGKPFHPVAAGTIASILIVLTFAFTLLVRGICAGVSTEESQRLINSWVRFVHNCAIPMNADEVSAVEKDATRKLRLYATVATIAIKAREEKKRTLDMAKKNVKLGNLQAYRDGLDISGILQRSYKNTQETADQSYKEYLALWDLFTKEFPNGVCVLPQLGTVNPETWRLMMSDSEGTEATSGK